MKGRKIITISIIMNLILVGMVYNLISKINVNNKKQVIKEMSEIEYEDYITELNQSHEDYANYIEQSKAKIASAITDMGVPTSDEETLETMANNIKSISGDVNQIVMESTLTRATSISKSCDIDDIFIVYALYDFLSNIEGGTILDTKKMPSSSMDETWYLVKASSSLIKITWTQINQAMFVQLI